MNVVIATDENYAIPAAVCLTSLFENHIGVECRVVVLTDHMSDHSTRMFKHLQDYYNQVISFVEVSDSVFHGLKITRRLPVHTYYRLILSDYIKEDRVLYLDCDTIVLKNLVDFYSINLKGIACGVVEDQRTDDISLLNHLDLESGYFNAGVLLVNLDYWRENNIKNQLLSYLHLNLEKCIYNDQDALNVVLHGKVKYLDYAYNMQALWFTPNEFLMMKKVKWHDLELSKKDPAIVHYTKEKPWNYECNHPLRSKFLYFAQLHSFIHFRITHYYSLPYRILMRLSSELIRIAKFFR